MTARLWTPFREEHIPLIGFVNEGQKKSLGADGVRETLDLWLDAGASLGNHTDSHLNIDEVSIDEYTADIVQGETILRAALSAHGKRVEFFRHPFLHTGSTVEMKQGLQEFLDKRRHRVAPVTLDNADYEFAALYTNPEFRARVKSEYVPYMERIVSFFEQRSKEVTGTEIPQILLIHASQMNADLMRDLLAMFKSRGYAFISLDEALRDRAYSLKDGYTGKNGISWIHRWAVAKGMEPKSEPDVPGWVQEGWRKRRSRQ